MPDIQIKDMKGNATGSMALPEDLFGITGKEALLHEAVVNFLANQRQGTHATKTRGLVRGGGRKPHKQKHTGRARAGSIRSPIWRGGGITFGPQPRDYSYKMPKQARRQALYAALSMKISDEELTVVEGFEIQEPKTKQMTEIIGSLGAGGQSLLIVESKKNDNVALSSRNIPGVHYMEARNLHTYAVISHRRLLVTRAAMEVLKGPGEGSGEGSTPAQVENVVSNSDVKGTVSPAKGTVSPAKGTVSPENS